MPMPRSSVWVINPDIVRRFNCGQTVRQIAEAYGVKWDTVYRALDHSGVPMRRQNKAGYRPWTDQEIGLLVKLRGQDWTYAQIADAMGRTETSVQRRYERLCKVPTAPDVYMRLRGVQYEDVMSMVRSA